MECADVSVLPQSRRTAGNNDRSAKSLIVCAFRLWNFVLVDVAGDIYVCVVGEGIFLFAF